ncbi:hypothetical protein PVK06_021089 [Gossypium arboreum]|uniref:RNase H type-1 domain-containing protein n=1 Tax=Gossypium arboreum TaxID=29729 RepID=A0ABR0PP25_GOSAR|nr:hypothetical protein PVK06_021089 [Gossypium arboreum]
MEEYEGMRSKKSHVNTIKNQSAQEDSPSLTVKFDAAFNGRNFKSATGLVAWGIRGELLALKSNLHSNVSAFAAEAYACYEAIKLGISMGLQSVKIMGIPEQLLKSVKQQQKTNQRSERLSEIFKIQQPDFKRSTSSISTDQRT